ncbi:MAG: putative lipid II flippase FtsW [Gammaproteobacteria bacterium]|nr:putative lipid II flippase FtsW [Gammaproteobacteria bacterium]
MILFAPERKSVPSHAMYDKLFVGTIVCLIMMGLMMVSSSSVMMATKNYHQPFYFLIRQSIYLGIGFVMALIVMRLDTRFWEKNSFGLLLICLVMMIAVLIPGVGKMVNGSRRWLAIGPIGIQVSELAKLLVILYMSSYLVRQSYRTNHQILGFLKPMLVLSIIAILLLLEPDFGATVVIVSTVMMMLFLSGVRWIYYIIMIVMVMLSLAALAIASPYRVARLTAFLNPWADQFKSGYQLTQALIAFGRGGWCGQGLGDSIQKMFYLPEAHTDFLFAVIGEELGFVGIFTILVLYALIFWRGLAIGFQAFQQRRFYAAFASYGLTCWLVFQALINMGVNSGMLPTKGLTLPFLSYGGASLVVNCIVIALLLRIDHENRWFAIGLRTHA